MDARITGFIQEKKLAMVGASRDGESFGNYASKELKGDGFEVLLVHRKAKEIDGQACYKLTGRL